MTVFATLYMQVAMTGVLILAVLTLGGVGLVAAQIPTVCANNAVFQSGICCIFFSTNHVNTQIYFCDQKKAIATCSTRLTVEKLSWRCKNKLVFDHRFCGLPFSRLWYACSEKIFGYSLQTSARRIVQSAFSILPCEDRQKIKKSLCTILDKLQLPISAKAAYRYVAR